MLWWWTRSSGGGLNVLSVALFAQCRCALQLWWSNHCGSTNSSLGFRVIVRSAREARSQLLLYPWDVQCTLAQHQYFLQAEWRYSGFEPRSVSNLGRKMKHMKWNTYNETQHILENEQRVKSLELEVRRLLTLPWSLCETLHNSCYLCFSIYKSFPALCHMNQFMLGQFEH